MRFSLKKLLIVVTLVAVVLGVQQFHRQSVLRQMERFESEGVVFHRTNAWQDLIWLRPPIFAQINVSKKQHNEYVLSSNTYALNQLRERIQLLTTELKDFGTIVAPIVLVQPTGTIALPDADSLR